MIKLESERLRELNPILRDTRHVPINIFVPVLMSQAFSQVLSVPGVSFKWHKNLTTRFYAHFTDEDTEAKGGETLAQSLGRIPRQDSERRQVGGLTASCPAGVGVGVG